MSNGERSGTVERSTGILSRRVIRKGYRRVSIADLCHFVNGNGFRPSDWKATGTPIIRIQNLNGSQSFNYYDGPTKEDWIVEPGDLLYAWAGVRGVSFGPTVWVGPRGVLNQHIYKVVPGVGVDRYWLFLALKFITGIIESRAHGFKSSLVHVHKEDITGQVVEVPPVEEQQKIARVLQTWDRAIEKATRLAGQKQRRYNALRSAFTVATTSGREYPSVHLAEITKRIRRKNDGKKHPVMTVSAKSGFVLQSDKYARDMAGSSIENYVVLHRGEFAYNKGNSLTSPQGCIFRLDREKALVPHVYFCFALNDSLHADFFVHVFQSGHLNHQLSRVINSGVRNDGLLNLNPDDFFKCRVPLPTLDEQVQIAHILNDLKREVDLQEEYVRLLKAQKRGLMEKLLNGKWRVKSDSLQQEDV